MADPRSIERVLKRLQLAASSSAGEAQNAVSATVSFMRRESVTVDDLLQLPTKDLYRKSVLIDIARAWVAGLEGVTDYEKRQREDQLIDRIASKWARESGDDSARQKEEELRRREEELRRKAEDFSRRQQQEQADRAQRNSQQQNHEEAERERRRQAYNQGGGGASSTTSNTRPQNPKPAPSFRPSTGTGRSFLRKALADPKAAFDLMIACFFFGGACGYVALFVVAIAAKAAGVRIPGDPDVTTMWAILTFPFMVGRGLVLFDRGWFR